MDEQQPTYKDITNYNEIATFLQDWLKRESIEATHLNGCTYDEAIDWLRQMEDDLLRLADKIKVVTQDVEVGAIKPQQRPS